MKLFTTTIVIALLSTAKAQTNSTSETIDSVTVTDETKTTASQPAAEENPAFELKPEQVLPLQFKDHALISQKLCITFNPKSTESPFIGAACNAKNANQRFTYTADSPVLRVANDNCIGITDDKIVLKSCQTSDDRWIFDDSKGIRPESDQTKCLKFTGTVLGLADCKNSVDASMQWVTRRHVPAARRVQKRKGAKSNRKAGKSAAKKRYSAPGAVQQGSTGCDGAGC